MIFVQIFHRLLQFSDQNNSLNVNIYILVFRIYIFKTLRERAKWDESGNPVLCSLSWLGHAWNVLMRLIVWNQHCKMSPLQIQYQILQLVIIIIILNKLF